MYKLFVVILVLVVSAFLVDVLPRIAVTAWPLGSELVIPGPPQYSFPDIKDRMEYHGVKVAWHDEKGQWWFNRAGERCLLRRAHDRH